MTITPTPSPAALQLGTRDQSTPQAAATGFAVRFFSLDTTVDHSPGAGPARAALFATPALAVQLMEAPAGGRTGADWNTLVKYRGVQQAAVKLVNLGDIPPDTSTTAIRTTQVHIEAHGSGGWYSIRTQLFNITLTRSGGVWEVSGYQLVN